MSKFEDRLWREIVRDHGVDLEQIDRPPARLPRRARSRLLAGTTIGLAGAGTALALAFGAASSSPAFAVSRNHDGSVTVVIKRLAGISGVNQKLAQLGIRARAVRVIEGCAVLPPPAWRLAGRAVVDRSTSVRDVNPAELHARLVPAQIPAGHTLVIAVARSGRKLNWTRHQTLVRGAVPDCVGTPPAGPPPGAPAGGNVVCRVAGPPPGGNSGNSGNSGPAPTRPPAGNGGHSGAGMTMSAPIHAQPCKYLPPPPGRSGNSHNSGNSGNSGNS